MSAGNTQLSEEAKDRYWAKTRNLTIIALVIWFIFSLVVPYMAPTLNSVSFLGFPLGYYMIAQGSLIVFVLTIFWHNWAQDKVDDEFGLGEE